MLARFCFDFKLAGYLHLKVTARLIRGHPLDLLHQILGADLKCPSELRQSLDATASLAPLQQADPRGGVIRLLAQMLLAEPSFRRYRARLLPKRSETFNAPSDSTATPGPFGKFREES